MDNEKPQEALARVREMHLLANIIHDADKLKLDFDSLIRVGRYIVQLGKAEQLEAIRNSSRGNYAAHVRQLNEFISANQQMDPESFRRVVHTHCMLAEQAAHNFNSTTLPVRFGQGLR